MNPELGISTTMLSRPSIRKKKLKPTNKLWGKTKCMIKI